MYSSTQQFVRAMDAKDIKHSDPETAVGDREAVTVIYSSENIPSIRMRFFFDQDCRDVAIRVFDLVKVPEAKLDVLLKAVNAVNRRFRFAKFVLDTDDNSIQAELDAVFRSHDVGDICLELMARCVNICDEAYPDLMKALWA